MGQNAFHRVAVIAVCALLRLTPVAALAQGDRGVPEFITDRPDFTESSSVVGTAIIHVEMGTTFESDRVEAERERTFSTPLALVRVGIARRVEVRLSTDGYILDSIRGGFGRPSTRGRADLEVGTKIVLLDGTRGGWMMAVLPMTSLPTGSDDLTSGSVDPTVKVTWSHDLPKSFGLSGNANVERLGDERGRYTRHVLSFSLGHELRGGWNSYCEAFGFMPKGRPGTAAWTVDTGVTHGVGPNAQVDVEVGRGVTRAAPDWFVGVGVGLRTTALRQRGDGANQP